MLNFTRHRIFQPNWQLVDLYCFDVHWSSLSIFGSSDPRYIILSQLWFMSFFFQLYNLSCFKATKNNSRFVVHKKTSDSVFEVWTVMARVHPWEMDQKSAKVSEALERRRIFWQICGEKPVSKTNGCVFLKRNYTWVFPKIRLPQNGWFIIDKYRKPTTIFLETSIYHGSCSKVKTGVSCVARCSKHLGWECIGRKSEIYKYQLPMLVQKMEDWRYVVRLSQR